MSPVVLVTCGQRREFEGQQRGKGQHSIVDHVHIIEALEARDAELAHVRETVEHLDPRTENLGAGGNLGAGDNIRTHRNDEREPT